jgi:hypothetical protein
VGEGDTRNEVSGSATNAIQARDISGGVHIHHSYSTAVALALAAVVVAAAVLVESMSGSASPTPNPSPSFVAARAIATAPPTTTAPPSTPTPTTPTPTPSTPRSSPAPVPGTARPSASPTGAPPQPVTGMNSANIVPGYTQTVTVHWNPQPDATSFDIHYTTSGTSLHHSVDTITNIPATTTPSYDFTAYHGETSCIYIRARNQFGVSPWGTDGNHCFNV